MTLWRWTILLAVAVVTVALARTDAPVRGLWPPLAALAVIMVTRHALIGLLAGGFAGALLLAAGHPVTALADMLAGHLWPSLQSSWKLGAIAFTFILGGFAAILEAGGAGLGDVLKVTVYVSDIGLWGRVNEVYAEFFGEHRPARAVVPSRDLHHGFQIEIEAIAAIES